MRKLALAVLTTSLIVLSGTVWAQQKPQAERITDGPVVKDVKGTTAEVAWSTNEPGSSIVKYGTDPHKLNQTAEAPWGGGKEGNGDYNHTVWLKNLKPNTKYYYDVRTGQGALTGTEAQSQPKEFQTPAK